MIFIDSQETLERYIPNAIPAAKGERGLYDKILPELEMAEARIDRDICPLSIADGVGFSPDIFASLCMAVAAESLAAALPKLDVVVTPNGLGVVATNTIGAASEHRSKALRDSLILERDTALHHALRILPTQKEWIDTAQGQFWTSTVFPGLSISAASGEGLSMDRTLQYREYVIDIQIAMASDYISGTLMERIVKSRYQTAGISQPLAMIASMVRSEILSALDRRTDNRPVVLSEKTMLRIVDYIRNHPADFPEWEASQTSRYFEDNTYKNSMNSGGYFF